MVAHVRPNPIAVHSLRMERRDPVVFQDEAARGRVFQPFGLVERLYRERVVCLFG
jgi:hypothetical protein